MKKKNFTQSSLRTQRSKKKSLVWTGNTIRTLLYFMWRDSDTLPRIGHNFADTHLQILRVLRDLRVQKA